MSPHVAVAILAVLSTTIGNQYPAKAIRIVDGDSLHVLRGNTDINVRLEGIDCPELGQPFGREAKEATHKLAYGKTVTVQATGVDKYGRTLANVILPDGKSLNEELVWLGYAWWFRKYSNDKKLTRLEAEAKQAKRGLWVDSKSIPPWDWRDSRRPKLRPTSAKVVPNGVRILALLPNPVGRDEGNEQAVIGNTTDVSVNLAGWKLRDRAGNEFTLSGTLAAAGNVTFKMTRPTMPLNNNGDEVLLIDPSGVARSRSLYSGAQVRSGAWLEFAR